MDALFATVHSSISAQNRAVLLYTTLVSGLITIILVVSSSSYVKSILKRFLRIQIQKRLIHPYMNGSDTGPFLPYYRNILCRLQETNNELLGTILRDNHSSAFFVDRSISFLPSHRPSSARSTEQGYSSIDEFRRTVPLTTFEDYRLYTDRIMLEGKKNQLIPDDIIYFLLSSGTTGKPKAIPITRKLMKKVYTLLRSTASVVWRSLPASSYPAPEQRSFFLTIGRKAEAFAKTTSGIPMGPFSQLAFAVTLAPGMRSVMSSPNVLSMDLIEQLPDFRSSTFVQLVFALAIPDLYAFIVIFAPEWVHTITLIETYFEEMSACIASASFNNSAFIKNKIRDQRFIATLNRALSDTMIEYGGATYGLKRAAHIREQCLKKNVPGLLHRLWPRLVYASTAIGGSFSTYKEQLQFYCGEKLPLINCHAYMASEGCMGTIASIYTDEYFPSPTSTFLEFIKEEDVHEAQPKTLLLSEIEPGNRYELVCTAEAGLVRYRMGDIVNCTRFLTRADDLVPLPAEPKDIPRIPLLSMAYRIGNLLDVFGEKTTEQYLLEAFKRTVQTWQEQGISVHICDFTCYTKLDICPPHYVIFLELTNDQRDQISDEQFRYLQNTVDATVEQNLANINFVYGRTREGEYLDSLRCFFVRSGTFSTFIHEVLLTDQGSPVQIKPHRLLKSEQHIRFFHGHQLQT